MRTLPISSAPLAARALLSPARMVVVCGGHAWTLGVHLAAQMACEYKQVLYLCGDNRFDPYLVARLVRSLDESQEETLSRILVARAFTAYQLDELIHRLNPEEAFGVVIISGVCAAFFDEDVTHSDAARMFYRSLRRLGDLSREGVALLLTESEAPKLSKRAYFLADLCRASNVVMRLESEHSFTLERRRDHRKLAE
ncbi:MAG: hypothetical protein L0Y75_02835 [Acidobacteria bacterium]|nr:hypothetical protein [Acidobacteriota bacterium]